MERHEDLPDQRRAGRASLRCAISSCAADRGAGGGAGASNFDCGAPLSPTDRLQGWDRAIRRNTARGMGRLRIELPDGRTDPEDPARAFSSIPSWSSSGNRKNGNSQKSVGMPTPATISKGSLSPAH
jgi:hypothetical protein